MAHPGEDPHLALPQDTGSPSSPANSRLPGEKHTVMPPKPKENSRHQPDDIKFPVFILGIRGKIKVFQRRGEHKLGDMFLPLLPLDLQYTNTGTFSNSAHFSVTPLPSIHWQDFTSPLLSVLGCLFTPSHSLPGDLSQARTVLLSAAAPTLQGKFCHVIHVLGGGCLPEHGLLMLILLEGLLCPWHRLFSSV